MAPDWNHNGSATVFMPSEDNEDIQYDINNETNCPMLYKNISC